MWPMTQYYVDSRQEEKNKEPKCKDEPYINFLEGKLKLTSKGQRKLTQFISDN
jgi:hypothetical protein